MLWRIGYFVGVKDPRVPWAAVRQTSPTATRLRPIHSRCAHDGLLLRMQQNIAHVYSGLNVRSCRLATRSTSTRRRHACCPT